MKLRQSARTDVGKTRDHNEDTFGIGEGEPVEQMGELLVVCDGMGGHAAGEVASQIAVETILAVYYGDSGENRPQALEQAFEQANAQIYARGQGSMGTTGVAALLHHDALHIANVGDSRAYLVRDGEIRQVSRDHSFVSDQVAAGLITADQARLSPHRNVITRALGYQPEVLVDLFRLPLQIGDIIVLSSDGMHGLILDQEILETVTTMPPDQAVERLIDLANSRGGTDNITVNCPKIVPRLSCRPPGSSPRSPRRCHSMQ
jgi:serine/threonine protein phosphatase PrpC